MKTRFNCILSALLLAFSVQAQENNPADSTGLPGDHFSLEGALELFKKTGSPEEFEKLLNTEDNYVNNLDLNEDGEIDYIRVVDNMEGDAHAIVLQVSISENEAQDIAVIEVEKTADEEAILQIVGDEDIFGEQTIVEPFEDEAKSKGGGPAIVFDRVVVNVWLWPSVRFVYGPRYKVWVSPWRWHHNPHWWKPWRPHPWGRYHARTIVYRPHYHVVTTHRVVAAHKVYTPRRTSSKVVHTRTTTVVTARGKGGKAEVSKTTAKTTVNGRNGKVIREKTTTRAGKSGQNGAAGGQKTKTKVTKGRKGGG